MADLFRRAGVELNRSAEENRDFWGLLRAMYATIRPTRPADGAAAESGDDAELAEDTRGRVVQTGTRCLLWLGAGWQLSLVSFEATALANTGRGLWVAVTLLWAIGMLFPRRPGLVELSFMAAAFVWAVWPN